MMAAAEPEFATTGAITHPDNEHHHAQRWWVLAIVGIAQLMVALDATVVNIALPTAQKALAFSNSDRQWIITGYALAFGSLLLIGGRLADLIGVRRVFLTGLAGFAAASAVGGAANGFAMLVTARAVQGAFAALLAPAGLSLLTTSFTDLKERARAFSVYAAIGGGGGAVGLILGGLLTEYASWRWTMFINVVFAATALVGAILIVRHVTSDERPRLDWLGTATVSAGLFALVYGVSHAETAGWDDSLTLGLLAAAVVLLTAFAVIQRRVASPLLPLWVILDRNRGGSFLGMFAAAAGMFAVFLFLTYYLQLTERYSAVRTGVAFLPMVGILIVAASGVSGLAHRVSPRILVPVGMIVSAAGLWILTGLSPDSSYVARTLPGTMIFGAGLGIVFPTTVNGATHGVRRQDAGVASAAVNTVQQAGGSIGTALLNTIAASAVTTYAASHSAFRNVAALAVVHSYTVAFIWAAAILVVGAVAVAALLRSRIPGGTEGPRLVRGRHVRGTAGRGEA
jgi:EmrB/QacA subfamily drug resistance transporter